jgi:hypothetical protein
MQIDRILTVASQPQEYFFKASGGSFSRYFRRCFSAVFFSLFFQSAFLPVFSEPPN